VPKHSLFSLQLHVMIDSVTGRDKPMLSFKVPYAFAVVLNYIRFCD
jgi:hypothetical protein